MADTDTAASAPADTEAALAPAAAPETAAAGPFFDTEPSAAPDPSLFTQHDKDFFRTNIRWLMAELDWAKSGRTAEERATLNP